MGAEDLDLASAVRCHRLSTIAVVVTYCVCSSVWICRYYEHNVTVGRTVVVGEDVCLGSGAVIGDGSRVAQSVVGRNVRIGKGVDIVGCYIQDCATIQVCIGHQY